MPTIRSNSEERPTCKMTPEQLLGLQKHARAKTATLTPEIEIVDPANAVPKVIAEGTGESVPIVFDDGVVEAHVPTEPIVAIVTDHEKPATKFAAPGPGGAIVGFVLFGAVTVAEILLTILS